MQTLHLLSVQSWDAGLCRNDAMVVEASDDIPYLRKSSVLVEAVGDGFDTYQMLQEGSAILLEAAT